MSDALYNKDILRLATSIPNLGRLAQPDASVERRSLVCGSRISVDVTLGSDGRIAAFGQDVKACALGQASASLLGGQIIGATVSELAIATEALRQYLAMQRPDSGPWHGLSVFAPAIPHSARHAAILLPFEAATEAAETAQSRA